MSTRSKRFEHEYHKQTVAEGLAKGKTQRQIALLMQVSSATVNKLAKELKAEAKASIQHWINEELPLSYQNTLVGINQIISQLWDNIEHSVSDRDKNNNTALLLQAYGMRLELLSSAETLKHTVNFVDSFTKGKTDNMTNKTKKHSVTKKEDNKNEQNVINVHEDTSVDKEE